MAASIQIILRKRPNSEGLYPLAIRITKDRHSTYKYLGHYIDIEDWDDKNKLVKESHYNSEKLNELIQIKLNEAQKRMVSLQAKDRDATAFFIKKEIYKPSKKSNFF
ncbi:Arm DNA-binding domain-containing protein [Galbibacter pacificus]|uniref:Arm DNA-binding domain-containing protein n=1 Tax=Galbibacter pacificus TaxID=2996052 RepID=A0ABT6FWJ7_9FLAO|nr:Arm DNA-binding domain-containing protein [Galbibacter pacificus]MDG3583929.1 Arm DNA-binding domain-containing protein [Galbibacter pacificus]MDG3587633.1 Arm DNA-binding domain-containing protein [Galbibacter pacificus]